MRLANLFSLLKILKIFKFAQCYETGQFVSFDYCLMLHKETGP